MQSGNDLPRTTWRPVATRDWRPGLNMQLCDLLKDCAAPVGTPRLTCALLAIWTILHNQLSWTNTYFIN